MATAEFSTSILESNPESKAKNCRKREKDRMSLKRVGKTHSGVRYNFWEVTDSNAKFGLQLLKQRLYIRIDANYPDPRIEPDPFDEEARFFILQRHLDDSSATLFKSLRAVNKQNKYGILPLELNLMTGEELREFCKTAGLGPHRYKPSTLNERTKKNLKDFLDKFKDSPTFYEVGGLFGEDSYPTSNLRLIYEIGKVTNREKWDAEVQTCHPNHTKLYLHTGYPYKILSDTYTEYHGWPAVTLSLEKDSFKPEFERLERLLKETNPSPGLN